MIVYSEKVYEKDFSDEISKKAYLEACKWLATYVYGRGNLSEYITVQIQKQQKKKKPTFRVTLFITINEKEVKESYCKKCQQLHTIFYCIDKPNCSECKITGYRKQLQEKVSGIKDMVKEILIEDEEWED